MNFPSEIQVLHRVCGTLQKLQIPYMLTGSFAMHFYAEPRMTRDIDIVVELVPQNVTKLCKALGSEFYSDEDMAFQAIRDNSLFNAIFHNTGLKLDFVIRKQTEYAKEAFSRKREMELLGNKIFVSSAEDLILSKLDWARDSESEMQLRDVSNLLKVKKLNIPYIEEWINTLGLKAIYEKAKSY